MTLRLEIIRRHPRVFVPSCCIFFGLPHFFTFRFSKFFSLLTLVFFAPLAPFTFTPSFLTLTLTLLSTRPLLDSPLARSFLVLIAILAFFFAKRLATRSASAALAALRSCFDIDASLVPREGSPLGTVMGVSAGRGC